MFPCLPIEMLMESGRRGKMQDMKKSNMKLAADTIGDLEGLLATLHHGYAKLAKEYVELQATSLLRAEAVTQLEGQVTQLNKDNDELKKDNDELTMEIVELRLANQAARKEAAEATAQLDGQITQLDLTRENAELRAANQMREADHEEAAKAASQLEVQVTQLKNENGELTRENAELRAAEAARKEAAKAASQLERQVTPLTHHNDDPMSTNAELRAADPMQEAASQLEGQVPQLQKDNDELARKKAELFGEIEGRSLLSQPELLPAASSPRKRYGASLLHAQAIQKLLIGSEEWQKQWLTDEETDAGSLSGRSLPSTCSSFYIGDVEKEYDVPVPADREVQPLKDQLNPITLGPVPPLKDQLGGRQCVAVEDSTRRSVKDWIGWWSR